MIAPEDGKRLKDFAEVLGEDYTDPMIKAIYWHGFRAGERRMQERFAAWLEKEIADAYNDNCLEEWQGFKRALVAIRSLPIEGEGQ